MEKLKERSMVRFVLARFLNMGIGLAAGMIIGLVLMIISGKAVTFFGTTILAGAIMSLLSINLYDLCFYYRLSLDIDAVCKGDGKETESYLVPLMLGTVTFGLYTLYWKYKLAQRLHVNAPRYGFKMPAAGKDVVVLDMFSGNMVGTWEMIHNINRVAAVYNQTGLAQTENGGVL